MMKWTATHTIAIAHASDTTAATHPANTLESEEEDTGLLQVRQIGRSRAFD